MANSIVAPETDPVMDNGQNGLRAALKLPAAVSAVSIDDSVLTYTENDAPIQIDASAMLSDPDDDTQWDGGQLVVQITNNAEAADELSIVDNSVGTIHTDGQNLYNGTTLIGTLSSAEGSVTGGTALTITFNAAATNAVVQQVLQSVHYASSSENPGVADRIVTVTATDALGEQTTDTRTIDVIAQNDAPTATGIPTSITVDEATRTDVDFSGVTLDDAEGNPMIVRITASEGQLEAEFGNGVFVLFSGTNRILLFGRVESLNTYLQDSGAIQYTGPQDLVGDGAATLTITANDFDDQTVLGTVQVSITDDVETQVGTSGNDILTGGDGSDVLIGLGGNDILRGGGGGDTLEGGRGWDWVQYNDSDAGVTIDLTEIDGVQTASGGDAEGDVLSGIEHVNGSDFADVLIGNGGVNVLVGEDGDDDLSGGLGNDILRGGAGADRLDGGAGVDWIQYTGSDAGITIDLTETDGFQSASGGDAEGDVISGFERVNGSKHDDVLTGNNGANTLIGAKGDDTLDGGRGNDTLQGSRGADIFVFSSALAANNVDIIVDFSVGEDSIQLNDSVFAALTGGTLTASAFAANATGTAETADTRIIYQSSTGDLFYDADGLGGADAVQFATMTAGLALTHDDFVVTESSTGLSIDIARSQTNAHESIYGLRSDTSSRGTDLVGSGITATFADGTSETLTWQAFDPYTNGGVTGTDISMLYGYETHELTTTKLLTSLQIDLAPSGSAFDSTVVDETDGDYAGGSTPGSLYGFSFYVTPEYETLSGGITATYSGIVNLVGRPADGDLYTTMTIDFSELSAGGILGDLSWNSDIDSMQYAGDLLPAGSDAALSGDDILTGTAGVDFLNGSDGEDTLTGLAGDDTLIGGADADVFVFEDGSGHDVIVDFDVSSGDILNIAAFEFANLNAVLAVSADDGSDMVIDLDADDSLTLVGVNMADLTNNDFELNTIL